MSKTLLKNSFGWGIGLWVIGYVLSLVLFPFVSTAVIGWIIMPIGIIITLWVLVKKVKEQTFSHYLVLAIVWTVIAVLFDYLFIVKAFNPEDGYYKLDVYLYYILVFIMPLVFGAFRRMKKEIV